MTEISTSVGRGPTRTQVTVTFDNGRAINWTSGDFWDTVPRGVDNVTAIEAALDDASPCEECGQPGLCFCGWFG